MSLATIWRHSSAYFDNAETRLAIGGTVAFTVVGNQPFYPFTVAYVAGAWVWPAFATWLTTPLFLLAPVLARKNPGRGRLVLLAAAFGNTALSAVALGPASGVELFYAPCLLLAAIVCPPGIRWRVLCGALAATAAALLLARLVTPWSALNPAQAHALAVMHAISAGCIAALMGFIAVRRLGLPGGFSRTGA